MNAYRSTFFVSLFLGFMLGCDAPKPNSNEILEAEKAFLYFADEKAALLRPNRLPIVGTKALEEFFSAPDSAYLLTWEPLFAEISSSGDLGYAYGIYTYSSATDSTSPSSQGTYVSIWKKTPAGWKYVLDSGNPGLRGQ